MWVIMRSSLFVNGVDYLFVSSAPSLIPLLTYSLATVAIAVAVAAVAITARVHGLGYDRATAGEERPSFFK